jgi:hypothetical protein
MTLVPGEAAMPGKNKQPKKHTGEPTPAELKALYAKYRREFTAADLQKYTEVDEELVPMEQVIAELEDIHKKAMRGQRKQKKTKGQVVASDAGNGSDYAVDWPRPIIQKIRFLQSLALRQGRSNALLSALKRAYAELRLRPRFVPLRVKQIMDRAAARCSCRSRSDPPRSRDR